MRQYRKVDRFWLPEKDQTFVEVRLYGKKILTIDHQNYVVNAVQNKDGSTAAQEARMRVAGGVN